MNVSPWIPLKIAQFPSATRDAFSACRDDHLATAFNNLAHIAGHDPHLVVAHAILSSFLESRRQMQAAKNGHGGAQECGSNSTAALAMPSDAG